MKNSANFFDVMWVILLNMSPKIKTLLLTAIIAFSAFYIWLIYLDYIIALQIIPGLLLVAIYVWQLIDKRKIPEKKKDELSDASKKRVDDFLKSPEGEEIRKEWEDILFPKKKVINKPIKSGPTIFWQGHYVKLLLFDGFENVCQYTPLPIKPQSKRCERQSSVRLRSQSILFGRCWPNPERLTHLQA